MAAAHRFSCPPACGVLVPGPGIKCKSLALKGGFFITRPPRKSPSCTLAKPCPGQSGVIAQKLLCKLKSSEKFLGSSWTSVRRVQGPKETPEKVGLTRGKNFLYLGVFLPLRSIHTEIHRHQESVFEIHCKVCACLSVHLSGKNAYCPL